MMVEHNTRSQKSILSHVMRPMPTVACSVPHTSETNVLAAAIMPLESPSRNLRHDGSHESPV